MSDGRRSAKHSVEMVEAPADLELAFAASKAAATLFDTSTPIRLGRYVLLERLGSGGMGVVYAAYDPEVDRRIAVKVLRPSIADQPSARARLVREARALGRLGHPNVVAVHDVGTIGSGASEQVFVAMELVRGLTLGRWLAESRSSGEILGVMLQAGEGLAAAHASGLVHRDFKPDNVMVGDDGRVRVMDFGLARRFGEDDRMTSGDRDDAQADSVITSAGEILGTPAYMAPEQLRGSAANEAADQFAFCVVLWEALCGARPFAGASRDTLLDAIEARQVAMPRADGLARSLRPALLRGLASAPDRRYPSMSELVAALRRAPRRRRRIVGTLIVGVGAGLAATIVLGHRAAVAGQCVDAGHEIDGTWNPAARAGLSDAFANSEARFAASTWERVEPRIATFAEAWTRAREEACRAHRIDATVDDADAEQIDDCLAESRERFGAVLVALGDADESTVRHAHDSIVGLSPPDHCRDPLLLATHAWIPPPAGRDDAVAALRSRAARVRAYNDLGRYAVAADEARQLVDAADELGWAPYTLKARMLHAYALEGAGELAAAVERLQQALDRAMEIGDDQVVALALIRLVYAVGIELGEHERARGLATAASALLLRLEPQPGPLRATLANQIGALATVRGRFDEAIEHLREAQAIAERVHGPEHPLLGSILDNLGGAYFRRDAFDDARRTLERAVELRTAALGPEHPDVGTALSNLAVVYIVTGDVRGRATLQRSLAVTEAALGPEHPNVASVLVNLAQFDLDNDRAEAALPNMRRALAIREHALGETHRDTVHSLLGLAKAQFALDDLDAAIEHAERALVLREQTFGEAHVQVTFPLDVIGDVHRERGSYEQALAAHLRALAIREREKPGSRDLAKSLTSVAMVRDAMGEMAAARDLFERAQPLLQIGGIAESNRGIIELRLASLSRRAGDLSDAAAQIERARTALGPDADDDWELAYEEGLLLHAQGHWDEALARHQHALAVVARDVGSDTTRHALIRVALADDWLALGARQEASRSARSALEVLQRRGTQPAAREHAQRIIERAG